MKISSSFHRGLLRKYGILWKIFSSMALKPINIRWIKIGIRQYWKSCIASYYRQFFKNIKIKIIKSILLLLARAFGPSGITKLVLISHFFHFNIHGKLSIIRCNFCLVQTLAMSILREIICNNFWLETTHVFTWHGQNS